MRQDPPMSLATDANFRTPLKNVGTLCSTRRKQRIHVLDTASIYGKKNERRTPILGANKLQKHTAWRQGILRTLALLSLGTCLAVYFLLLDADHGRGTFTSGNTALATFAQAREELPSSHGAKVFTVNRFALEKLEYLHRASGIDEERDVVTWDGRWPPLVTHIPEPKLSRKKHVSYAEIMDACGPHSTSRNPCRFLIPYRIAEQESKARLHLWQLIALAEALNRTLVLPNVGKSRMGICPVWEFEDYYDTSNLQEQGVVFSRFDVFKAWIESRRPSSSAALVIMAEITKTAFDNQHPSQDYNLEVIDKLPDIGCVMARLPNLSFLDFGAASLNIPFSRQWNQLETAPRLIEAVQNATKAPRIYDAGTPVRQDPDVLVIDWNLRHAIFPSSAVGLQYSPRLRELSNELSPREPYIAVHWRMESILHENLPRCANDLVHKLGDILRESSLAYDIGTIWLASDISFDPSRSLVSKSGTLKAPTLRHQEAVQIVLSAFRPGAELAQWKLQTLEQSLGTSRLRNDYNTELISDSGVRGILDKIIAAEAVLFIGGAKKCSRVSSYTRQITEMRRRSHEGDRRKRNIIDLFG